MSALLQTRAAIAASLRANVAGVAQVVEYGGQFDLAELKRMAARSPSLVVASLGAPKTTRVATVLEGHGVFLVVAVASGSNADKRNEVSATLAEYVATLAMASTWSSAADKTPTDIAVTNLYSRDAHAQGISMWAVRWTQWVKLERAVAATLDDLKTIVGTYDIGGVADTPKASDQVELPT
jgi:phage gp37-like protein